MSVLVEALTLIVPRHVLDARWPGGTDAFLAAMLAADVSARHVCHDDRLASVSFLTPEATERAVARVGEHCAVEIDGEPLAEFAVVDQRTGPTLPCSWLEWRRHPEGFASAWLAGTQPGDLASPAGWTPEHSRRLVRTDARDQAGHMLRLAEEGGVETWLDFDTGRLVRGTAVQGPKEDWRAVLMRASAESCAADPTPDTIEDSVSLSAPSPVPVIEQALRDAGIAFSECSESCRFGRIDGVDAAYDVHVYGTDTQLVVCLVTFAVRVPEARRAAVGEALHRINILTPVGAFELDYDSGLVRFRTGVDVEGTAFVPQTVGMMLSAARHLCDSYHAAVLRVAFGEGEPKVAIAEAQRRVAAGVVPAGGEEAQTVDAGDAMPELDLDAIIRELEMDVNEAQDEAVAPTEHDDARHLAEPARRPYADAYVVPGARLIAGEYPGARRRTDALEKLARCLDAGVDVFVDLTEDGELRPYEPLLRTLAAERGVAVDYHRLPIRDVSVCDASHMRALLDTIDRALDDGRTVYVHCWGGVGRTGITVGCWLVEHGATGEEALATVGRLFATMSPAKLGRHPEGSPQTRAQREFVRQWRAADRTVAPRRSSSMTTEPVAGLPPRPDIDRVRGSLLGGAVGDALGAPVEFMTLAAIRARFGPAGITSMQPAYGRVGAITDDTQMTLFTAEGILRSTARFIDRHHMSVPDEGHRPHHGWNIDVMRYAYLRWLETQGRRAPDLDPLRRWPGWLTGVRALHSARAPGNTCLSALASGRTGTRDEPLNDSKGCGGVMRVAPVGLVAMADPFTYAADAAALTHGHPSGYLAAGALALIVNRVATGHTLGAAIDAALGRLASEPGHEEVTAALRAAVAAYAAGDHSAESVERLGGGWVAEEALGIAVFCALAAEGDFERGVVLAANHSGDTDSTAAITGNILGAMLGAGAIPARWLEPLELRAEIEQVAADLYVGWQPGAEWATRYPPN